MADPPPPPPPPPPKPEGNPALRMMGLPRLRAKLPSRNWSIFLTITGTFAGLVGYDRYQTKLVRERYCRLVAPISAQPLSTTALPRKVTVYLVAPPGDSISAAREHFRDYVKPVLNAAAVEWEVVEGRQQGEVQRAVAEGVRTNRKGEVGGLEEVQNRMGIRREEEGGVVVVGRQAWKEWVRGMHEGWLGPVEKPVEKVVERVGGDAGEKRDDDDNAAADKRDAHDIDIDDPAGNVVHDAGGEEKPPAPNPTPDDDEKPVAPIPYITPAQYSAASVPSNIPTTLPAVGIVRFPHLLGIMNTPIRLYRYVTRRDMAEEVCREAAAVALGVYRPFIRAPDPEGTLMLQEEVERGLKNEKELAEMDELKKEEGDWQKRVWENKGVWTEDIKVDERVAGRMRRFYIPTNMEPKEE